MRHASLVAAPWRWHPAGFNTCLTRRSTGPATAGHAARTQQWLIMLRAGGASCRVGPVSSTLGHTGETFSYPKCNFLVLRRLDTNLGHFREVRGSSHLCGGSPFWLFSVASFSGTCSALKQSALPRVAHCALLPPSSHLPPTVQAWPNHSLKRSANGRPPGPLWRYAVHFRQPGPGVLPSAPA